MAIFFALNGLSISFPAIFSTELCYCWSYTTTAIDVFVAVKTFSIRSHFFPFHCKSKWKEKWIGKVPNSQLHSIIAQQVPLFGTHFDVVQSLMNFNRIEATAFVTISGLNIWFDIIIIRTKGKHWKEQNHDKEATWDSLFTACLFIFIFRKGTKCIDIPGFICSISDNHPTNMSTICILIYLLLAC